MTDLEDSARSGRDEGSIAAWLGGTPDISTECYAQARLQRRLPAQARHVLLHGAEDRTVSPTQSRSYAATIALSGDDVSLDVLAETGHYALIDPRDQHSDSVVRVPPIRRAMSDRFVSADARSWRHRSCNAPRATGSRLTPRTQSTWLAAPPR